MLIFDRCALDDNCLVYYLVTDCHACQSRAHPHFSYIVQTVPICHILGVGTPQNGACVPEIRLRSVYSAPSPQISSSYI